MSRRIYVRSRWVDAGWVSDVANTVTWLLDNPQLLHWQVICFDETYEITGQSKNETAGLKWRLGDKNDCYTWTTKKTFIGESVKTRSEMHRWCDNYVRGKDYDLFLQNCQQFVYEFTVYATNGNHIPLPKPNSTGGVKTLGGPVAISDGISEHYATTGHASANWRVFSVKAEGPNAQAVGKAHGSNVSGYVNATAFEVSANAGIAEFKLAPNLKTGANIGSDGVGVSLLGFGTNVGPNGANMNTPVGSVNCCVM